MRTALLGVLTAAALSVAAETHHIAFFPAASDAQGRQGFARIVNQSAEDGEVSITAYDEDGTIYGPIALTLDANETQHFNSSDLEDGNEAKGLTAGIGMGPIGQDWRLVLSTDLSLNALSYIRTGDGFLTAMHDLAAQTADVHTVAFLNPGSNMNQRSYLRLANPTDEEVTVTIDGVDDRGDPGQETVSLTIQPQATRMLEAYDLEEGAADLEGALGDGVGKWRLDVEADGDLLVVSILTSPTGHITNLSTDPGVAHIAFFPAASDARGRQGFARIVNQSGEDGEVGITAYDEDGAVYGPITLTLDANETQHFNSTDLEDGNEAKGMPVGIGMGPTGEDWRLEFASDLDINVLAYIRTSDGFLTAMHDPVPKTEDVHRVVFLNPGSNSNQRSYLRLANPTDEEVAVTIDGVDDRGNAGQETVGLTLQPQATRMLEAYELEEGAADLEGTLGDGGGKWRLDVGADGDLLVVSILTSPTGHITNLSTDPGLAADEAAADTYCRDGDTIEPGERCDVYGTDAYFEVDSSGSGCYRNVPNIGSGCLSGGGIQVEGGNVRIHASMNDDNSWTIDDVEPEPGDGSGGSPDLVAESASVSDASPEAGATFTLSATVRNAGGADAAATTLRYYRSDDDAVSSADTEVGTDSVGALAAGADSTESITLTAPSEAGTYHYGACVDAVSGESSGANNCSGAVEVTVSDGGGETDSYCRDGDTIEPGERCDVYDTDAYFEVDSSGSGCYRNVPNIGSGCLSGGGIQVEGGNVRIHASMNDDNSWTIDDVEPEPRDGGGTDDHGDDVAGATSVSVPSTTDGELEQGGDKDYFRLAIDEATTLTLETTGSTDTYGTLFDNAETSLETDDDDGSGRNFRIVRDLDAGTYYVEVRGYDSSTTGAYRLQVRGAGGGSQGDAFDLDPDNGASQGIAYADETLYVLDWADKKVYGYAPDGRRVESADFDLDSGNADPFGVTYGADRIWVSDRDDDRVYAYRTDGSRDPSSDFDLDSDNGSSYGITYAGGKFWVADVGDDKVYAYATGGGRDASSDFDLDADNGSAYGITHARGTFWVVDRNDDKVYAYRTGGDRDASSDFDLDPDNGSAGGITHAEGSFYVPDHTQEKIYVYSTDDGGGGPDLVAELASVSDAAPDPGASFTLSATVRNAGDAAAPATTLRYYRSVDETVSSEDSEVGTASVGALAAGDDRTESITLTAPSEAGTVYYGACVDSVAGESASNNNCSAGIAVTVSTLSGASCEVDLERNSAGGGTETVDFQFSSASSAPVGNSNVPTRLEASLGDADDFDVYEIGLDAAGRLAGLSIGSLDTQAVFVNDDCAEVDAIRIVEDVGQLPNYPSSNLNFAVAGDLPAGSYYLVVFEWAGRTGDYALELLFDDPQVNDAPVILAIPDQELAPGDSATVPVLVSDDRRDTHAVTALSGDVDVATVAVRTQSGERRSLVLEGVSAGTASIAVDASDQHGVAASTVSFDVVVVAPALAAPAVQTGSGAGQLDVAFNVTLDARETRAFDYQLRRKAPQSSWETVCIRWANNRDSELTTDVTRTFSGLAPGVRFEVRYRDRGAPSCADGPPGSYSAVGEGTARAEARTVELASANGNAAGIAHIDGVLYVVDAVDDKVYAYATSGERDAEADFDLVVENGQPEGITAANGKLYVADDVDARVYAYHLSGSRDEDSEFDLHSANDAPRGITYANGKFHVVDRIDDRVYVYEPSGSRDEDSEFDLHQDNGAPAGVAFAGSRFHVVDWADERAYAYNAAGEREAGFDFDLDGGNTSPEGIVHAQASFFVVDDSADQVFVYAANSGASTSPLVFLDAPAAQRSIPENVPGGIDVGAPVEATGGDMLTYDIAGPDAASFDIVAGTGQLRTADEVVYDYETKHRYMVEVVVADAAGNRETLDVTIDILDLAPACGSLDDLDLRTNSGDGRLTLRWNPLPDDEGQARIQGYQTQIRRGSGAWTDRRTFLGRSIVGSTYADLDNDVGYEVRVRPIHAEGDCEWSAPVSGTPTGDLAPKDDGEFDDRFGPHPIGSDDRNFRQVVPGRCRHTLDGVGLDANCTYNQTGPDAGLITLEFDDPSKGSCDVAFAYSSLTAGSFHDECFNAGVNVPFDRSFRMPEETPDPDAEVPRAPRTQEEFDVFASGREDLVPGFGFGCPKAFEDCVFAPGLAYTVGRDPERMLPLWSIGDYSYENTGPSSGVVTFRGPNGTYTITLEFTTSQSVRATIEGVAGDVSTWPGMPHLDLSLGAQPVLLPIPPSWSAAIAMETDFAPDNLVIVGGKVVDSWRPILFGSVWDDLVAGSSGGLGAWHTPDYEKIGRNRTTMTVRFDDRSTFEDDEYEELSDFQRQFVGSTWTFDMTFVADGVAEVTLTIRKDGQVPRVIERRVDFHGDDLDEFPAEAFLPDEAPQAAGEDLSGIEVAAAINVDSIGSSDLQTFLVSATGGDFRPGDYLEPKDGGDQRMMIVGAGSAASAIALSSSARQSASGSVEARFKTRLDVWPYPPQTLGHAMVTGARVRKSSAEAASSTDLIRLSVVCMQGSQDIPSRGARYFSKAKAPAGDVQLCQKDCVLEGGPNIQGCVWSCED